MFPQTNIVRIITFSFYEKRGRIILIVSVLEIFIPLKSIKKDEGTYIYYFLLDQKNKKKKFIAVHIDFIVQLARKSRSTEVRHLVPPPLAGSASHVSAVHRPSYNPGIRPTPVGRQTSLLIAKYLSGEDQLPQLSIE